MISQTIQYVTDLPDDFRRGLLPTDCLIVGQSGDLSGLSQLFDTLAGSVAACGRLLQSAQNVGAGVNLVFEEDAGADRTRVRRAADTLLAECRARTAPDDSQPAASDALRTNTASRADVALSMSSAPGINGLTNMPGVNGLADMPGVNGLTDMPGGNGLTDMPGVNGLTNMPGINGLTDMPGVKIRAAHAAKQMAGTLSGTSGASVWGADSEALSGAHAQFCMPDTAAGVAAQYSGTGVAGISGTSGISGISGTSGISAARCMEPLQLWTGVQTACNLEVVLNPAAQRPSPLQANAAWGGCGAGTPGCLGTPGGCGASIPGCSTTPGGCCLGTPGCLGTQGCSTAQAGSGTPGCSGTPGGCGTTHAAGLMHPIPACGPLFAGVDAESLAASAHAWSAESEAGRTMSGLMMPGRAEQGVASGRAVQRPDPARRGVSGPGGVDPSDGRFVMPDLAQGITPAGDGASGDLVGGSVAGLGAAAHRDAAAFAGRAAGVTLSIGNLIGEFTIHTTNLHEDTGRVKELVTEALISAVNDVNYG